jgi:GINS complex subunit 1
MMSYSFHPLLSNVFFFPLLARLAAERFSLVSSKTPSAFAFRCSINRVREISEEVVTHKKENNRISALFSGGAATSPQLRAHTHTSLKDVPLVSSDEHAETRTRMSAKKQDASAELISELRALIASGGSIGAFDDQKVRAVLDNIQESYDYAQSIASNPYADMAQPYYASSVQYYRAKCLRDKRCVLTYMLWRQQQVADAWWGVRDNLLEPSLSSAEGRFLSDYHDIMVEYMTSFDIPLDVRAYLWRPPSVNQLEVRGLTHYEFRSSVSGKTIIINVGDQLFLSFEEAEPLIQQGIVELVGH